MVSDRSEHEPEEYDPEAEYRDPDSDSITIPKVSTEDAGSDLRSDLKAEFEADKVATPEFSSDEVDVDSELLKTFWALVIVINAAVLAVALGVLFLIFEGATFGIYLVAVGLVLAGFALRRYRNFQQTSDDDTSADARADETAEAGTTDGTGEHGHNDDADGDTDSDTAADRR
ncbi:DUF7322 domain-containing protein [Natronorubrum halalkaliphilum]|uniref:DUF7322 domain-containing protein n=1 Tax=Natronorubrum halalkaliphilum TaxID=2691917 RepID=UPI002E2A8263|nr:hypothetical protein [Natronorubrum halalkaliphilum]